ncbi:MAG: NAAT family transporter [Methanomicrobiaceae archaeon]|nr:NAAT family transporter [Methanomicrobiaceae archaeon]
MVGELLSFALLSFSSVFIIVNPLGATLIYVVITEDMEYSTKIMVAKESCRIALLILLIFALAGTWILTVFGITLEAFRIAGGILLFGIAMEMVYAKPSRTKMTATEKYESIDAEDVSVMPMAIPMIAGPGSITTVVVLTNEALHYSIPAVGLVIGVVVITIIITYLLLVNAESIVARIGQREYRVINRLMGILLMAIAVQFVLNGLSSAFPLLTGA